MRHLLIAIGLISPLLMSAQEIFRTVEALKVESVSAPDQRTAALSADGRQLFLTSLTGKGLKRIDLSTGSISNITEADGAGIEPSVSADGQRILHRSVRYDEDHMRRTSLIFVQDSREELLIKDARELGGYRLTPETAIAEADGRRQARSISPAPHLKETTTVSTQDLQLSITIGGKTNILNPNGTGDEISYLWASLSPDGQHILYYVAEEGAYVCNLEGKDVQFIDFDLRAPQWYDNETIIGMNDQDDGETLLSSSIVAHTLSGDRQQLTAPGLCLMFPKCGNGRVACANPAGDVYLLNLKK